MRVKCKACGNNDRKQKNKVTCERRSDQVRKITLCQASIAWEEKREAGSEEIEELGKELEIERKEREREKQREMWN